MPGYVCAVSGVGYCDRAPLNSMRSLASQQKVAGSKRGLYASGQVGIDVCARLLFDFEHGNYSLHDEL